MRIQDKSGREHIGRITRVTEDRVWLEPVNQQSRNNNLNRNQSRNYSNRNYSNNDYAYRDSNRFSTPYMNPNAGAWNRGWNSPCFDGGCGGVVFSIAIGFIFGIALAALFFF